MRVRWLIVPAAAAVLVLASGAGVLLSVNGHTRDAASGPPTGPYRGSHPPAGVHLPNFALRSYRGPIVRSRDLRGKVVVTAFLDTACRDQCPIIAATVGAGIRVLTRAERSRAEALAITVLPPADTPEHVRRFLRQRRALGKLDWLIAPLPALRKAWKDFAVLSAADSGDANLHSSGVRVFTREGVWVSTLRVGVDLTPANLAHDIRVALRARS